MPIASGVNWIAKFPTRADAAACVSPFREKLEAFLAALTAAGATVRINATLRPPQRAYLMQTCWDIAHGADPTTVKLRPDVDIDWVVRDANGNPDIAASRAVAQEMVNAYGIVARPSLTSLHITGEAVDMDISWAGSLQIADKNGAARTISSSPRDGTNLDLADIGRSFGVIKAAFGTDPPHWSSTGS
jgi:hypothetical protein